MIYRTLGRTKLKVSVIGFGGGPLEVVSKEDATFLIEDAIKNGINIIDIDKIHKENEEKVGDALALQRNKMHIMAKSFAVTKSAMDKAIQESLLNLKTDYIDIYQMHLVRDSKDLDSRLKGAMLSLQEAKKDKKINFIGVSGHHIPTLIEAIKTNKFDTALVPYNLGHIFAEKELFDTAKSYNVGIITMKPLGGGMLVDPRFYSENAFSKAKVLTAENALKFVLSNKNISCALVGFNKKEQIDEATSITNKEINLTKKEINVMNKKVYDLLGDDYCRNCKYCLPCEGTNGQLEIDKILRLYTYYTKYGYKIRPKIEYLELKVKSDACTNCGKCIQKCPYNIPIPKQLIKAHTVLTIKDSDLMERANKEILNFSMSELKQKYAEYYVNLFRNRIKIEDHNKDLVQKKKELAQNQREIASKNKMIKDRESNIQNKEKELSKIKETLSSKEDELRLTYEKLMAVEKELHEIHNSKMYRYILSTVWKIKKTTKKLLTRK